MSASTAIIIHYLIKHMPKINSGGNYLLDSNFILNKARIKEGDKIADLGCGAAGHFVFPASKLVGGKGTVYAVDIMKTVLTTIDKKIKEESLENIKTVWSDVESFGATDIASVTLDVILIIDTLYQSEQRAKFLKEAIRMLKTKAYLLVVEWKNTSTPMGPPKENRVEKESLKRGALKMGLTIEEEFEAGDNHYGILFIK